MPAINLKHETFIREMIAHGDRRLAYKTAYPTSSDSSAYFNACRLLAKPDIRERIRVAVSLAEKQVSNELKQQFKAKIMDTLDKRRLLARIARGEIAVLKNVTHYNRIFQYEQRPGPWDILNAIALDCKLEAEWKRKIL